MFLVHTDESGINFKTDGSGIFSDGPYIIFGGLMVHENKYHHLERMFAELVNHKLGISDWSKNEIHAHELWNAAMSGARDVKVVKEFFEELLQLLSKMSCPLVLGIDVKQKGLEPKIQFEKKKMAAHAMIHILEYKLAAANQNGILIFDKMNGKEDASSQDEREVSALLSNMVAWRSISSSGGRSRVSKFDFESRAVFLMSNLHYVPSNESLMLQVADCVVWIVRRMLTHHSPLTESPDPSKCPVTQETFCFFMKQAPVSVAYFSPKATDFSMTDFSDFEVCSATLLNSALTPVGV
ncbi:MAG: DUF3800 domain-containing protein [Patescibacteria group bacterium]